MTYRRLFSALLTLTCLAALAVALSAWLPLRAAAGLLLVLVLPGTLATYAALPPDSEIDGRLRAVLSVALSITLALVLGLVLALASDHESHVATAVGLGSLAAASAVIAFVRDRDRKAIVWPPVPQVPRAAVLLTMVLIVPFAFLLVLALNVKAPSSDFTALTLTRHAEDGARIQVENHEGKTVNYRYVLREVGGRSLASGAFKIRNGRIHSTFVRLPGGSQTVRAVLYRAGDDRPYRLVTMRLGHST